MLCYDLGVLQVGKLRLWKVKLFHQNTSSIHGSCGFEMCHIGWDKGLSWWLWWRGMHQKNHCGELKRNSSDFVALTCGCCSVISVHWCEPTAFSPGFFLFSSLLGHEKIWNKVSSFYRKPKSPGVVGTMNNVSFSPSSRVLLVLVDLSRLLSSSWPNGLYCRLQAAASNTKHNIQNSIPTIV